MTLPSESRVNVHTIITLKMLDYRYVIHFPRVSITCIKFSHVSQGFHSPND